MNQTYRPDPSVPHRILVIDDNCSIHTDFRKILVQEPAPSNQLQSLEANLLGESSPLAEPLQFTIDSATQGRQGCELVQASLAAKSPFALAFVDMRMPPGWDGIETTLELWKLDPNIQVVLCTAYSDYSWGEIANQLKASDRFVILKKPFDNVEVLQLAHSLAEKWRLLQTSRQHLESLESTIQRRTENLQRQEFRFRMITDNASELIALLDRQGHWIYRSPSYRRTLAFSESDLDAMSALDLLDPNDRDRVSATFAQIIDFGEKQTVEYNVFHQDGSRRTLESQLSPIRDQSGSISSFLVVARDITAYKLAEKQRQELEIQLRQAQKLESIG